MSELQIAWLELTIVGGLGAVLALSGVVMHIVMSKHNTSCTKQTEAIVVNHACNGQGRMCPVVEYYVDGICYQAKKKFRGVMTKRVSGVPTPISPEAYEDEKGWLHVKTGPVADYRQLAEGLWPLKSKMTVFYNPSNPKRCYVDRPISSSFTSIMFIAMGLAVISLGVLVFFLIRL